MNRRTFLSLLGGLGLSSLVPTFPKPRGHSRRTDHLVALPLFADAHADDLVVALVAYDTPGALTWPRGWTVIEEKQEPEVSRAVAYRMVGSGRSALRRGRGAVVSAERPSQFCAWAWRFDGRGAPVVYAEFATSGSA